MLKQKEGGDIPRWLVELNMPNASLLLDLKEREKNIELV